MLDPLAIKCHRYIVRRNKTLSIFTVRRNCHSTKYQHADPVVENFEILF